MPVKNVLGPSSDRQREREKGSFFALLQLHCSSVKATTCVWLLVIVHVSVKTGSKICIPSKTSVFLPLQPHEILFAPFLLMLVSYSTMQ